MNNLQTKFLEKVIKDTKELKIIWSPVFQYTHNVDERDLIAFKSIMFENDYHSFNYASSFICKTSSFVLLLATEEYSAEANADKKPSLDRNLYIAKDIRSHSEMLTLSNQEVEELYQAIYSLQGLDSELAQTMLNYIQED